MPVARVVCSCTFHIELFSELETADGRIEGQALSLVRSIANALASQEDAKPLNPDLDPFDLDGPPGNVRRPYYVLPVIRPVSWSFVFNTFRKPDEFECTIPLGVLPIPPEAIARISVFSMVRQIDADAWEFIETNPSALIVDQDSADFVGECRSVSMSIGADGMPTVKLQFQDYLSLLQQKNVEAGKRLDRTLPISKAIEKFLVGTPAEGLPVVWLGDDPSKKEPSVEGHIPKAQKQRKAGKSASKPSKSQQNYLDTIVEECSLLGLVPRLNVTTLQISPAAPLYEGTSDGAKTILLVSQLVDSIDAEHTLLSNATKAVQVVGYNPDTGDMYAARWPADPKNAKPVVMKPGQAPRLPPVIANMGLPGHQQLDESVRLVPFGAVSSQERLQEIARMIFLDRERQRLRYTLKTHAPWSNPLEPDADGGSLLRLRAGDTIQFGYITEESDAYDGGILLPPEVRALVSGISAEGNQMLLERAGVAPSVAHTIGAIVANAARLNFFRVDELHIAGGSKQDVELTLKIVNFTQVIDDVQRKTTGRDTKQSVNRLISNETFLATLSRPEIENAYKNAQEELDNSDCNKQERAQLQDQIDASRQRVIKKKR